MIRRGLIFSILGIFGLSIFLNFPVANAGNPFEVNIFYPEATGNISALNQLEQSLGAKFSAAIWYQDWDENFNSSIARSYQAHGTIPTLIWQPQVGGNTVSYAEMSGGAYDRYLNSFADSVKSLGFPVRISLAPEMNAEWEPWGVGNAGDSEGFKNFWRHTVSKFRERGAGNAQWIWAPNIHHWGERSGFGEIYPGDEWVDFMGLDGYNWGASRSWSTWQSFNDIFGGSYGDLTGISSKPILITELASTEVGGNKAGWISDTFQTIRANFPQIAGIYWFNINKETDWRINSSDTSFNAFKAALSGESPVVFEQAPAQTQETLEDSSTSNDTPVEKTADTVSSSNTPTESSSPQSIKFRPDKIETSVLPLAKTTFFNQKVAESIPGKILGTAITIADNDYSIDHFISFQTQIAIMTVLAFLSLIFFVFFEFKL